MKSVGRGCLLEGEHSLETMQYFSPVWSVHIIRHENFQDYAGIPAGLIVFKWDIRLGFSSLLRYSSLMRYSSRVFKPVLPVSCEICLTHSHACVIALGETFMFIQNFACFPYSTGHMIYSRLGDQIDSAQCVFRLNAAPTLAHELDVGRKTTARVLSSRRWVA